MPLQALRHLLQALLHPVQAVVHTVEAVVHPLPVLPYVSRAIPSVLAPTGPSPAGSSLAATPAPFPSAAATAWSLEVPPSASASTHANFLLRLIAPTLPGCVPGPGSGLTGGPGYCPRSSSSRALRLASTSAASAAACDLSSRWRSAAYSGSVSQWVASTFNAASSPVSA